MKKLLLSLWMLPLGVLCTLLLAAPALALDGSIEKVDPPRAKQGQTVMLTITGRDLPVGGVALDFFPQRIQLVKILSSDATEIVAQIRIPNLAPAGAYNILVYNHLGEEAFGEQMFLVDSDLVAPVISDFDPKVIAEADNGFAVMLSCDGVNQDAVSHLSMEWSKGSLPLRRLETFFSVAGTDRIVAAVTGALPEGAIRGRLLFDNTPIYLVEITIRASGAYVLGCSPAELEPGSGREIRLIGSGFSNGFLDGLVIQLLYGESQIVPQAKRVVDANSISLYFDAELQPGKHTLVVRQGEETLLLEDIDVSSGGILAQDTNGVASQPERLPPPDTELPPAGSSWNSQLSSSLASLEIARMEMQPGAEPARFTLSGRGLDTLEADNLSYALERQSGSSELLFSGFTNNGITCIFGPVDGDWRDGEQLTLRVLDAGNRLKPFSQDLELGNNGLLALEPDLPGFQSAKNIIEDSNWSVGLTTHSQVDGQTQGVIQFSGPADTTLDAASMNGEFSFSPNDAAYLQAFSNITRTGLLQIEGSAGNYTARFSGLFVPGVIRFKVKQAEEQLLDSSVEFDFPEPAAMVDTSAIEGLVYDAETMTMDREQIICMVDFAPYLLSSVDFISVSLAPGPTVTHSDSSMVARGSRIEASLPTGIWSSDIEFGAGLRLLFESSLQLDWANGDSVLFPVSQGPVAAAGGITASMPRRPVVIGEDSFTLTILPRGEGSADFDWTRVKLSSDNMLLNNNIDSFAVSMAGADFLGEPAVNLIFTRGRGLGAEAFAVLADQLVESSPVSITLYWDEIRFSCDGSVEMVR